MTTRLVNWKEVRSSQYSRGPASNRWNALLPAKYKEFGLPFVQPLPLDRSIFYPLLSRLSFSALSLSLAC